MAPTRARVLNKDEGMANDLRAFCCSEAVPHSDYLYSEMFSFSAVFRDGQVQSGGKDIPGGVEENDLCALCTIISNFFCLNLCKYLENPRVYAILLMDRNN